MKDTYVFGLAVIGAIALAFGFFVLVVLTWERFGYSRWLTIRNRWKARPYVIVPGDIVTKGMFRIWDDRGEYGVIDHEHIWYVRTVKIGNTNIAFVKRGRHGRTNRNSAVPGGLPATVSTHRGSYAMRERGRT